MVFTAQVTSVFDVPVTLAVHRRLLPACTVPEPHVTEIPILEMVTDALADFVESALLVTVITT